MDCRREQVDGMENLKVVVKTFCLMTFCEYDRSFDLKKHVLSLLIFSITFEKLLSLY